MFLPLTVMVGYKSFGVVNLTLFIYRMGIIFLPSQNWFKDNRSL